MAVFGVPFSTGIAEIDAAHCHIEQQARSVEEMFLDFAPHQEAMAAFDRLAAMISGHFAQEEAFMTAVDYREQALHAKDHGALTDRVAKIRGLLVDIQGPVGLHHIFEIEDMLFHHIIAHDAKFAAFVGGDADDPLTPPLTAAGSAVTQTS